MKTVVDLSQEVRRVARRQLGHDVRELDSNEMLDALEHAATETVSSLSLDQMRVVLVDAAKAEIFRQERIIVD